MRSGKLRHVVTIERAIQGNRETGAEDITYIPHLEGIAAHVLPAADGMRGGEQYVSAQVLATIDTKIRIRYRPGMVETMRVRQEIGPGSPTLVNLYDIQAITPADERNRELWLWCRQRKAEGFRSE